jgi:hypothetical protein
MTEQENDRHMLYELVEFHFREREHLEFIPRREMVEQLYASTVASYGDTVNAEVQLLARGGLKLQCDWFAMTGPNETLFGEVAEAGGDHGLEIYWRYKVKREGRIGYVKTENLTGDECERIGQRLANEAQECVDRAEALRLWFKKQGSR